MKFKKGTFSTQLMLCILLLLFCTFLSFTPETTLPYPKSAIRAILMAHTDLHALSQKISSLYIKEETEDAFAPVTNMQAPTSGTVLKGFGMQDASQQQFHYGVVLSCPGDEEITSANHGTVSEIATTQEYGSYIIIKHSEEIATLYGSLGKILVTAGETVQAGQPLAKSENGTSFYLELRRGDTYLDPAEYITFPEDSHD